MFCPSRPIRSVIAQVFSAVAPTVTRAIEHHRSTGPLIAVAVGTMSKIIGHDCHANPKQVRGLSKLAPEDDNGVMRAEGGERRHRPSIPVATTASKLHGR